MQVKLKQNAIAVAFKFVKRDIQNVVVAEFGFVFAFIMRSLRRNGESCVCNFLSSPTQIMV